jgi:acetylglutamate kinase
LTARLDARGAQELGRLLGDALPRVREIAGCTLVVKYGGNAMVDETLKSTFARDVALLKLLGVNPVVVHGGGPQIGKRLAQVGKETRFVSGMRVTDRETMEVVEMVLAGLVNKEIVSLIASHGAPAVGLSGKDGGLIRARKLRLTAVDPDRDSGADADLGFVGEVSGVDPRVIEVLLDADFVPVIAPVGAGEDGSTYNINADLVAGKLAEALPAKMLLLLTNTEGLLDKSGNLMSRLDIATAERLMLDGTVSGGMLPKLRCAVDAVLAGVGAAHIIDGRREHCVLLPVLSREGAGTSITADRSAGDAQG